MAQKAQKGVMGVKGVFRPGQSTMQSNPLDAVVPFGESPAPAPQKRQTPTVAAPVQEERREQGGARKERFTAHLSGELIERARNAVYWTPGLTLARLTEEALTAHLDRMEQARGGSFDHRTAELAPGRPVNQERKNQHGKKESE